MPPRDLALIAVVIFAWGSNFTAMRLALDALPPMLFTGLRFAILVPLLALFPRPPAPWWAILGVGALINAGQFAFVFSGITGGVPAGLASLFIQMQVPFTIALATLFLREPLAPMQALGLGVALSGLAVFALSEGGTAPVSGLMLVVAGAACWASGNLILRRLPGTKMLPLFLWASLVPPLPMLALSLLWESPAPLATLAAMSPTAWGAVLYVAIISTLIGYTLWGALLSRHPAARVTPFALLIPVVGITTAALVLGERPSPTDWLGAAILILGLTLTQLRLGKRGH